MTVSTRNMPYRTTLWGGGGLVLSGLIALLASLHFVLSLTPSRSLFFASTVPLMVSDVVMLLATVILAFGVRGEPGIAGTSIVGKVALLVFGAGYLLFGLYDLLPISQTPGVAAAVFGGEALELVVIAAAVVAAVVVARVGVLHGVARWMLLAVGLWDAIWGGMVFIPSIELALNLAIWQTDVLMPVALIVLGVTYALQGRSAAIRQRLQTINEHW